MAIISYKRGRSEKLTENLQYKEFDCKCGKCATTLHDTDLSAGLQKIRSHFGKPLIPTSGYRCPIHNTNVGGGKASYHMKGRACDFIIPDVNVKEIAKYAESIGFYGIGCYPEEGFVHVDTRPASEKFFWMNSTEDYVETFGGSPEQADPPVEDKALKLANAIRQVLEDFGY